METVFTITLFNEFAKIQTYNIGDNVKIENITNGQLYFSRAPQGRITSLDSVKIIV